MAHTHRLSRTPLWSLFLSRALALILLSSCSSPTDPTDAGSDADLPDGSADADRPDGDSDTGPSDPCNPNPCSEPNRTTCVAEGDLALCRCDPGTHEEDGECVEDAECQPTTCNGHGTCHDADGELRCDCDEGYQGAFCQDCDTSAGYYPDGAGGCTDTPCDPNPCDQEDRRRCVVRDGHVECLCNPGTHDEAGECLPDESCTEDTCGGHGTCEDLDDGLRCDCDPGFVGTFCDACDTEAGYHPDGSGGCTTDPCTPNPCEQPNRSICLVLDEDEVQCDCDPGHHLEGDRCVIDQVCAPDSCGDHGDCEVVDGVIICSCHPGFTGALCDACDTEAGYHPDGSGGCTTDPCTPNPCVEPGQTVCLDDGDGSHSCDCDDGLHPDGTGGCTADPCVPDPCVASDQACRDAGDGTAECFTPECDDHNPCTEDSAVGAECVFDPLPDELGCSTTLCVSDQRCSGGVCTGGTTVSCDDGDPCTTDSCDELTGCHHAVDDSLVPDDGVACTVDSCSDGLETHSPDDSFCGTGSLCGTPRCLPDDPDTDSEGCLLTEVPAPPPAASSPCATLGPCDDDTGEYEITLEPDGTDCDDTLRCTTGDQCLAGVCRGVAVADCPPPSCSTTVALPGVINVPAGIIQGEITFDGAPPPELGISSDEAALYLVARDTEAWHRLGSLDYRWSSSTGRDELYSSSFATRMIPGVYDLLYSLQYDHDWNTVRRTPDDEGHLYGHRILQQDVVIGLGTTQLDVDVASGTITGEITFDGAPPPELGISSDEAALYLVAQDTGAWHRLGSLDYRWSSSTGRDELYSSSFATRMIPGEYDLLYSLQYDHDWNTVRRTPDDEEHLYGHRILQREVVITEGDQVLDVDVPSGTITGEITFDGAPPPELGISSDEAALYLVARDTEAWHRLGSLDYRWSSSTGRDELYSSSFATRMIPGEYDLLYSLQYDHDWNTVRRTPDDEGLLYGHRILAHDVVVTEGDQVLDVDVPSSTITGEITFDGLPPPDLGTYSDEAAVYLVSRDTGAWHRLGSVDYRWNASTGRDELYSHTFATRMIPGTYDLLYRLQYDSDWNTVRRTPADEGHLYGLRVLRRGVVITEGDQVLDVDVPSGTITGEITFDGAPPPELGISSDEAALYLVAQDTGAWHRLGSVDYRWSPTTGRDELYSHVFATRMIPGTYDLLYSLQYDDDWNTVRRTPDDEEHLYGHRILAHDVVITGGDQVLDVDVPSETLTGEITFDGAPPPELGISSDEAALYLVARDTEAWHRLGSLDYRWSSSTGRDELYSSSFATRMIPGEYDLLYSLQYDDDWNTVRRTPDDEGHLYGHRLLEHCVEIH